MNIDYFRRAVASVDDHRVHPARLDIRQRALKVGPVQGATGDATIVIGIWDELPTFVDLAFDIGLACLPLGMQRVEILLQALFGRFTRVDGAAQARWRVAAHRPKNLGPDQCAPVILRAIDDSEG